jgi:uncharacterized protein YidB (DUF937 family)
MGLFDSLAGGMLDKVLGEKGAMAQVAMDMLNHHGGLNGVLEKFKETGLAEQAASWVGKGENLPITAEQIAAVLGNGTLAEMAAKFGIDANSLSAQIAEHLPAIVDKLTPNGEVPAESGNVLSTILGMLK